MATDSSVAGYIAPTTSPAYDHALDAILQAAVAGITGIPGNLVRPRLQAEPPSQPAASVDWMAVGWTDIDSDTYAYEGHLAAGDGSDSVKEDELIEVLISAYGPNAMLNSRILKVGLQIAQNRDQLRSSGLEYREAQRPVRVPSLIKNQFVPRVDTRITFARRSEFIFPILNILSASFQTTTDVGVNSSTNVSN